MVEISYTQLGEFLVRHSQPPRTCLIHGEEALRRSALDALLSAVLPPEERSLAYDPVEDDDVGAAIERATTFSLLGGAKVVGLVDSRVFQGKANAGPLLDKTRTLAESGATDRAARVLVQVLGLKEMDVDDLGPDPAAALGLEGDVSWLGDVLARCRELGLKPAAPSDAADDLARIVEKGLPTGNFLVVTADAADKRRQLYKAFVDKGLVVDCSVPKGSGRADQEARDDVLRARAAEVLGPSGKTLTPPGWRALTERTGFDLRTVEQSLRKLIDYVGQRPDITDRDVADVLTRTRQDPIYELTGAVADRDARKALFFIGSLLDEGLHPLQIVSALANQIRRLILARAFLDGPWAADWRPTMAFAKFRSDILPRIAEFDQALDERLAGADAAGSELRLGVAARTPYPLYLSLKSAARFSMKELSGVPRDLADLDARLKSGASHARVELERLVTDICLPRKGGSSP